MEATTLAQLAEIVGGELHGDPATPLTGAWPLDDAVAGSITMIDHADRLRNLGGTAAAAVVLPQGLPEERLAELPLPAVVVANVHLAFAAMVTHFRPAKPTRYNGMHPTAVVDPTASVGAGVSIGAGAIVGAEVQLGDGATVGPQCVVEAGCRVGADAWLAARVTLYSDTVVGERTRLHSGVVLGADGFGYRQSEGRHLPVAQLGNVEVGADVEIGANTTIDRGVYGPTKIGDGTKIDNLVQIGHNCRLGRHNLICSQVGIAGSTSTGDYVVMAGQVGVRDHVHIGAGATLSAMAGVSNDVPEGAVMLGAPATPLRAQKLQMAAVAKLPQLRKEFRQLRREVTEMSEQLAPAADKTNRAA